MLSTLANFISEWWLLLFFILDLILILLLFFSERGDPQKFAAWALLFILLPILGFVLYIFLGQTYYSDHCFKVKNAQDRTKNLIDDADKAVVEQLAEDYPRAAGTLRVIRECVGPSISINNEVKLFTKGEDKFRSFFDDLRNAKTYICVEYYLLTSDEVGDEFLEIMTQKAQEGLKVRLLTDYVGLGKGTGKAIKKFKAAGGEYAVFHGLKGNILSPKKNNRNHRKIAVIDGIISYCGGFNIGADYIGKGPLGYWRDTAVRMRGSATFYILARFVKDWEYASKKIIDKNEVEYFPKSLFYENFGNEVIQIVSGGPDMPHHNPIRIQYMEMFKVAKETIWFHTPYLIPNDSITDILCIAAASGVDVKIIIPEKPDHMFIYWNNITSANRLMESGVKVYMYTRGFVHSKSIVVDGGLCSVGSANMDDRSLVFNFEANALIYSPDLGKQMMAAFEEDLKDCVQYSCEQYRNRTRWEKVKTSAANLLKNLA